MKYWKVCGVNFISSVDITNHEEVVEARPQELALMGRHVSPEQRASVDVVAVRLSPAHMVQWDQQIIEILFCGNNRVQVVIHAEFWISGIAESVEIVHNSLPDKRQGVILFEMQVAV